MIDAQKPEVIWEEGHRSMRKACLGLALLSSLCFAVPADAADNTVVGVGTGAVAGAVVAGPIGAVVGAVAGGFIGANSPSRRVQDRRRARLSHRRRAAALPSRPSLARSAIRPVAEAPASEVTTTGSAVWRDPR